MTSPTSPRAAAPPSQRYARYRAIIDCVTERNSFQLEDVKRGCASERPAFVTRVIRELAADGWITCDPSPVSGSARETRYRWNADRNPDDTNRWLDEKLFGRQIRESPQQERPRERLLAEGAAALKTSELLAILIRSGRPGESAVDGGRKVARTFDARLQDLLHAGRAELKHISPAVEKTAFCQIMAGIELGRRVVDSLQISPPGRITSTRDAIEFCRNRFQRLTSDGRQEEFHIVTLDTKNQVIGTHQITVGTLDASLVHPREVFRAAIKDAAASVILVHNPPSGDPTPSREDRAVTDRLESAGELLGIDVLDHIVLGRQSAVSIRES